jgi:hypothetical protein
MSRSTTLSLLVLGLTFAAAPSVQAQVVSGVMTVTGAEMH